VRTNLAQAWRRRSPARPEGEAVLSDHLPCWQAAIGGAVERVLRCRQSARWGCFLAKSHLVDFFCMSGFVSCKPCPDAVPSSWAPGAPAEGLGFTRSPMTAGPSRCPLLSGVSFSWVAEEVASVCHHHDALRAPRTSS